MYLHMSRRLMHLMFTCPFEGQCYIKHSKTKAGVCTVMYSRLLRYEYGLRKGALRRAQLVKWLSLLV
jgi:hypothetical protein